MRKGILIVAVLALFAGSASAGVLWDNNIVPNGTNGRALSPPGFPDIRVADDAVFESSVQILDFHANIIEDGGWTDGGNITLEVRDTADGGGPGAMVASHRGEFTKMDTGDDYFARDDFDYWIEGIDINLDAGTYWFTLRNEDGGGAGTNYWMTSDIGPDGVGSDFGWFSLDGGNTFQPEGGDPWNHAFVVTGIPEPSTCLLLGLGGLALLRRRR